MIKPTVGRIVWFTPSPGPDKEIEKAPFAAIVTHVWSDTCVNLAIFHPNGRLFANPPTSVRLLQPGEDRPADGEQFCEWMPYQVDKASQFERRESAQPGPSQSKPQPEKALEPAGSSQGTN